MIISKMCEVTTQAKYKVKQKKIVWGCRATKQEEEENDKKLRSNKQNIVLCKRKTM